MTTPRILYPATRRSVTAAYDGSLAVDLYDLMFLDSDDAKPASSAADTSTELGNQQAFGPRFVGLAGEAKLAVDPVGDIKILTDVQAEFDCVSETHEVGDLVTVDEAASGTALENQKLVVTTDRTAAIGYVIKRDATAASRVQVRLISRLLGNDTPRTLPVAQAAAIADPAETTADNNAAIDSILAVLRNLGFVAP